MSTQPEHDDMITPDDFDLDTWIASGTVATRTVPIYNDPALVGEYEALSAELESAEKTYAKAGDDAPLDAADPRPEIIARMEDLWERWEASKATWTVRALAPDEIEASFDADKGGVPHPRQPVAPPPAAGQKAAEKHGDKIAEWARKVHESDRERTLHLIAAAVTKVETSRGTRERHPGGPPIVTVAQLRALRDRPHGDSWVGHIPSSKGQRITGKLAQAVMAATEDDVVVPRPTSPARSTTDRA